MTTNTKDQLQNLLAALGLFHAPMGFWHSFDEFQVPYPVSLALNHFIVHLKKWRAQHNEAANYDLQYANYMAYTADILATLVMQLAEKELNDQLSVKEKIHNGLSFDDSVKILAHLLGYKKSSPEIAAKALTFARKHSKEEALDLLVRSINDTTGLDFELSEKTSAVVELSHAYRATLKPKAVIGENITVGVLEQLEETNKVPMFFKAVEDLRVLCEKSATEQEPTITPTIEKETTMSDKTITIYAGAINSMRGMCSAYLANTEGLIGAPDDFPVTTNVFCEANLAALAIVDAFPEAYAELLKVRAATVHKPAAPAPYKATPGEQALFRKAASNASGVSIDGGKTWYTVKGYQNELLYYGETGQSVKFEDMNPELVQFDIREIKRISFGKQPVHVHLSEKAKKEKVESLKTVLENIKSLANHVFEKPLLCSSEAGDTMVQIHNTAVSDLTAAQIALHNLLFDVNVQGVGVSFTAAGIPEEINDLANDILSTLSRFFGAADGDNRVRVPVFTSLIGKIVGSAGSALFLLKKDEEQSKTA